MYNQVKTSPLICDNNANFCQRAYGDSVKIQSRSGLSFLFFSLSLWLNTLSLLALWFLSYFFPEKSHRLVESKTVKGMFATRHGNTCPHSLPIAHQTHRPVDGCKPGWHLGRLNSIRSATQTTTDSCLLASVRATKNSRRFLTIFCTWTHRDDNNATTTRLHFLFIYLHFCGIQ